MKTNRIVAAIAAGSLLLTSGGVFAQAERNQELLDQQQRAARQGYPLNDPRNGDARTPIYRNDPRLAPPVEQHNWQRSDHRGNAYNDHRGNAYNDHRGNAYDDHRYDPRYYQRYDPHENRYYPGDHYGGDWRGRGAGPNHDWYRGSRLPREYNSRYYVVDDWRGHRLSAPPSGYHWVQAGGDYVLAAIATGVIAAILLNQ